MTAGSCSMLLWHATRRAQELQNTTSANLEKSGALLAVPRSNNGFAEAALPPSAWLTDRNGPATLKPQVPPLPIISRDHRIDPCTLAQSRLRFPSYLTISPTSGAMISTSKRKQPSASVSNVVPFGSKAFGRGMRHRDQRRGTRNNRSPSTTSARATCTGPKLSTSSRALRPVPGLWVDLKRLSAKVRVQSPPFACGMKSTRTGVCALVSGKPAIRQIRRARRPSPRRTRACPDQLRGPDSSCRRRTWSGNSSSASPSRRR